MSLSSSPQVDFYQDVPDFELSLDDFEEYALARLKLLRKIEELKVRNITGSAYRQQLEETVKANLKDSKLDVASHFILRAAYCQTEDHRRWFLQHECHLAKFRLETLPESQVQAFCKRFQLEPVSSQEKDRLRESLMSVPGMTPGEFASSAYYRIPFGQALDLIASRSCFVQQGMAYVPLSKVLSILLAKFRMGLSKSLTFAAQAFGNVSEGGRIEPLLQTMHQQYTGKNRYDDTNMASDQEVTANNIADLKSSMPLCMQQLQSGLEQDSKLKHWGRLQYGLFLKGAGMSMEESLLFFQRAFSKMVSPENFNKQYAYNIRHMYGKEGKRASYTPYNCTKIILGNPPHAGERHGCPYKHYDADHLGSLLTKLNIGSNADRKDILDKKKSKQFQLACQKHFEVMHPNARGMSEVSLDNVGNHPNAWFAASMSYRAKMKGDDGKEDGKKLLLGDSDKMDASP